MSQLRESKGSSSPSATHIENGEDKNETEDVQFAVEDVRLEEEENDRETGEALNQRQEEGEETQREAEGKEEEEASKGGDNRNEEEEENKEGEDQEEIKPPEEMENQEEMEGNVRVEEEGEESKEEEIETTPVAVDNSQERHNSPQGQYKTDGQDDQANLGDNAELDMESESEIAATPAEIPASPSSLNLADVVDDEHTSGDEPVIFTRRVYEKKKNHIEFIL